MSLIERVLFLFITNGLQKSSSYETNDLTSWSTNIQYNVLWMIEPVWLIDVIPFKQVDTLISKKQVLQVYNFTMYISSTLYIILFIV